jgi:hypothetical protein
MPESRDYYLGAIAAMAEINLGTPFIYQAEIRSALQQWIGKNVAEYTRQLANLPPADPAPDPSPCPNCAAVWGLVERLKDALDRIRQVSVSMGCGAATVATHSMSLEALALIEFARQKRGA